MKKRVSKKSKMTLDGLARMMQAGFADTSTKQEVQGLREETRSGFRVLDTRISAVEKEVRGMKENSSELFEKLDTFIKLYQETKEEYKSIAKQVTRMEERMSRLEAK